MPANTPGGWPYVLPSDHPAEYPAHSQQMAQQIENGFKGVWTPSGWTDVGGAYAGLWVTRSGPLVTIEGVAKHPGSPITANTWYALGDVPAGFRPAHEFHAPIAVQLTSQTVLALLRITTAGAMWWLPTVSGTIPANGTLSVMCTFRGA